jgi:hypothetical protein
MSITLTALMKQRYDTAANWTAANPTLLAGEIGIESDTKKWKLGDGSTAWTSLGYAISAYPLVNADIASNAEIAVSKLADGAARQLLQTDAAGTDVEWASNIDIPGTLDVTGAATFDAAVTIQGDLTVNGTTTTIDTANLAVEDKNIEIGKVASPTDVTADGGGITLKGTTDKTINWVDATDAWTFSEHVNIASGKEYRINGVKVLDATSLGSSVLITSANITDGTIVNADVNASAAIAGTKITPDFGSQALTTTGLISANGKVSFPLGTAALPSLYPGTDTNTGMYSPGADQVAISTNGSGRLFVDSTGKILIGTAASRNFVFNIAPAIQIESATDSAGLSIATNRNDENANFLRFGKSRSGSVGGVGVVSNGDAVGTFRFEAADGSALVRAAEITASVDGTPGTGVMPGRLVFLTTPSNSGTPTERMRLDSSGRLGLGTSVPSKNFEIAATSAEAAIALTSSGRTLLLSSHEQAGVSQATRIGTSSNHELRIITNNPEAIRIDTSQRVGIGTTSPTAPLTVVGADNTTQVVIGGSTGGTGRGLRIATALAGSNNESVIFDAQTTLGFANIRWQIAGNEAMRIDKDRRLLVGTSSARSNFFNSTLGAQVQIEGTTSFSRGVAHIVNSADDNSAYHIFAKSRGTTVGSNTIVNNNDRLAELVFAGNDGSEFVNAASIIAAVDGTPGANDMPGRLVFSTTADGAASPTERMRINNAGAVGVGGANFGSSGQVLTSNGSSSSPSWQTPTTGGVSLGLAIALA